MRSYSSLLGHILGSHSQIDGYCEAHLSYSSSADLLKLQEFVRSSIEQEPLGDFLFDKILGNHTKIAMKILEDEKVYPVFLIRNPQDTVKSILNMGYNIVGNSTYQNVQKVCTEYVKRIRKLALTASKISGRGLFISSEDLIENTDQVLRRLERFLNLSSPLSSEYRTFKYTGEKSYGDPSSNIATGKVIKKINIYDGIQIPKVFNAYIALNFLIWKKYLERHCLKNC